MTPTRGRPRQFDPDEALETIKNVFWANGYDGTSLSDLIEASGIPRQSLYNVFGDKRALFVKAVETYGAQELQGLVDQLSGPGDPLENLNHVLDRFEGLMVAGTGCLLGNEFGRLADADVDLHKTLRAQIRRVENACVSTFRRAVEEGTLSDEVSPAARGRAFFALIQGLQLLAKAGMNRREAKDAIEGARLLLR